MNDDVAEYVYLDNDVAKEREKSLLSFIVNEENDSLLFNGLDFLDKTEKESFKKIKKIIKSSVLDGDIILNDFQIEILSILEENNLFLSAPTSFGKTFIILEFIKRNISKFNNVVFIVPTLALMNELLKTINNSFSDDYNICINAEEEIRKKNIFIFVPERSGPNFISFIEEKGLSIDLLVFDEFYKMQVKKSNAITTDDRLVFLNKVYLNLVNRAKKIVLLAPFVKNVEFSKTNLKIVKYYTNFLPVYNKIAFNCKHWMTLIKNKECLVYFQSPESIASHAEEIIASMPENEVIKKTYKEEIAYLEEKYGTDWYVIDLLKRGIGVHHGRTPMFLRKFLESEYRNCKITLFCTSTLMEGINTPTERLIVVDSPDDVFALNNLIGRVGRLRKDKQIIGDVFICNQKASELYNSGIDNWLELKVLAERKSAENNEERFHLDKTYDNSEKEKQFNKNLKIVETSTGKTFNDISKFDVKFIKIVKFAKENFKNLFENAKNLYECVAISTQLLSKNVSHYFYADKYLNLKLKVDKDGKEIPVLPYNVYICKLLNGKTIREIIDIFNTEYNPSKNKKNINNFIIALQDAENYIKFKLSKIQYYFQLFDVDFSQEGTVLNNFIKLLGHYNNLPVHEKILEDLGIESSDFNKITSLLTLSDGVSTSKIINQLRNKSKLLENNEISPFTIYNIKNL